MVGGRSSSPILIPKVPSVVLCSADGADRPAPGGLELAQRPQRLPSTLPEGAHFCRVEFSTAQAEAGCWFQSHACAFFPSSFCFLYLLSL